MKNCNIFFKNCLCCITSCFKNKKCLKKTGILFSIILLAILIFFGYKYFQASQDREAGILYCELTERYQSALVVRSKVALEEIALDCHKAMNKYSISSFKPYFNMCRICSLLLINNNIEDICDLEKSLNDISKSSEFYKIGMITIAILLINQKNDSNSIEKGKNLFKKMTVDPKDSCADAALFYHGLYELNAGNRSEAGIIWSELFFNPLYSQSPFKELAEKAANWEL